jgi:3'-5' exoribonuclease
MNKEIFIDGIYKFAKETDVSCRYINSILHSSKFLSCSGSHTPKAHHYGEGGLLQHTYEVISISQGIATFYSGIHKIDKKVLFLAALYHDVGKCWDHSIDEQIGFVETKPHRRTIHHITRSAIQWEKQADILNLNPDFVHKVTHCILSHHGRREWGSPVMPLSREAWILHLSDSMSARVDDCDRIDFVKLEGKS